MRTRTHPVIDERAPRGGSRRGIRFRVLAVLGFLAVLPLASPRALGAQEVPSRETRALVELRLTDGSTLVGTILETRPDGEIRFRTLGGIEITVGADRIERIADTRGRVVDGVFWHEDPNPSRLLFTSTGRGLPQGEGYVGSFVLLILPIPFVAYGVTDRITIAAGTPIFPGFMGESFLLAPKVHLLSSEGVDLSAGALVVFTRENAPLSLSYAVGTFGNRDRALTVGFGVGVDPEGEWDHGSGRYRSSTAPIGMIGGEVRVSPRIKFVTENWILGSDGEAIVGGGIRVLGGNLSADLGIGGLVGGGDAFCCIPMMNFVLPFGGGR